MRLTATAIIVTLLTAVPASGQVPAPAPPPASAQHPYGLDPYDPSDAALLREYGVTLVAQTPLVELRKLDPYKPSHAALLRQLGGGIPLWGWAWYASPGPAPLTLFPEAGVMFVPAARVKGLLKGHSRTRADRSSVDPAAVVPQPASSMATLRRPESNDGVWIRYAEKKWISVGKTVPFEDSEFVQVGQYGDFPVFKRTRANEEVIYVPTRKGKVMPYRLKS
jgi:hypothetical protein